jgi:hypothetical protein
VSGWQTKNGHIIIPLAASASGSNGITNIAGRAYATIMNLTAYGKGWRTKLILRPEQALERSAAMLKKAMEK